MELLKLYKFVSWKLKSMNYILPEFAICEMIVGQK